MEFIANFNYLGICALFFDLRLCTDDDVDRPMPRFRFSLSLHFSHLRQFYFMAVRSFLLQF